VFNDVDQQGNSLLRDGSGFRNFVRMTKYDYEILLQKIGPRIQSKDTKVGEVLSSINTAVALASGVIFSTSTLYMYL
jgi:hypothetical protein